MAKAKAETDTRSQRQKFIAAAREHGAEDGDDAFRRFLKAVAKAPGAAAKKAAKKPKR